MSAAVMQYTTCRGFPVLHLSSFGALQDEAPHVPQARQQGLPRQNFATSIYM